MATRPSSPAASLSLNHHFFAAVFLTLLCTAAALGAIVSNEFASGAAMVNGSEGYATMTMGLWHGNSVVADRRETVYYEWCQKESPSFQLAHCYQLQAAQISACVGVGILVAVLTLLALLTSFAVRTGWETKLARIAAGVSGAATLCFAICLIVWAVLVLDLSSSPGGKAQLSIGISWLAEGGAFILGFLLIVNLLQTARRIEVEQAALVKANVGKGECEAMHSTKRDKTRTSSKAASHGGGELEA